MNQHTNRINALLMTFIIATWVGQTTEADILRVPSNEYVTIQSALDDAFPGDRIVIAEGRYEENLTVGLGGIEIAGAGQDKTTIVGKKDTPAVVIISLGGVNPTIRDLMVEGGSNGINAVSALRLTNVLVTEAEGDGITCQNSTYTFDSIKITQVGGIGLVCSSASLTLNNSTVELTGQDGISATRSSLTLNAVSVTQAGSNGILGSNDTSLTLNAVSVIQAGSNGILGFDDTSLNLNSVTITRTGRNGIFLDDNNSSVSSSVFIDNTNITRSRENGVLLKRWISPIKIRQSLITTNVDDGIELSLFSSSTADLGTDTDPGNNEIHQNGRFNVISDNSTVTALGNWWGTDSPNPAQFQNVTFEPWLTEPPTSPTIQTIAPDRGTVSGGTVIQITGTRFVSGATVTVNGTPATGVTVDSEAQITAIVPKGDVGPATVTVTNPDGKSVSKAEAFTYLDTGGITPPPSSGIYQGNLTLAKGINIFALPLVPETPITASKLATDLGATIAIRAVDSSFQAYVAAGNIGTDFQLEVGKGVIVNLLDAKTYPVKGRPWGTEVPAAPIAADTDASTWAFVVAGRIDGRDDFSRFNVRVTNRRTGESRVVPVSRSGEFTASFVDMSKRSVVAVGDEILTQLVSTDGMPLDGTSKLDVLPKQARLHVLPKQARLHVLRETSRLHVLRETSRLHVLRAHNLDHAYLLTQLSVIPAQTRLLQNYPNPFNPETWIPFQLAESASVAIDIYDLRGHLVRHLDVGHRAAGWHVSKDRAAYWNGRNSAGEKVSSGVYFYRLRAGDFSAQRKLVVAK